MKPKYLILLSIVLLLVAVTSTFKDKILSASKARGYLEYTADEAVSLAYTKCASCHNIDKILKYCFRCGPPFIVVVHNMKSLIAIEKAKPGKEYFPTITDAEAVAISQVWSGLIGNWEEGWRKEDLKKLLKGDEALIELLDTPLSQRKIEQALMKKSIPGTHKEGAFNPEGAGSK